MSPSSEGFQVGDTVRCVHNDNGDCYLCRQRPSACGYYGTAGVLGTVMDISDQRHLHFRDSTTPHNIRVAFLGHDRSTFIPTSEIALVSGDMMSAEDMQWKWSNQMEDCNRRGYKLNSDLDHAPDGSVKKFKVLEDMERLSTERRFIESVFAVLIP